MSSDKSMMVLGIRFGQVVVWLTQPLGCSAIRTLPDYVNFSARGRILRRLKR
jgi:hypothetical protein